MAERLPKWVAVPFRNQQTQCRQLLDLLDVSVEGITRLRGLPEIVGALESLHDTLLLQDLAQGEQLSDERVREARNSRDAANRIANLAETEIVSGFRLLHGFTVVALWASLESLINDFLAEWMNRRPTARRIPIVQRVRIRLDLYDALKGADRYRYVLGLIEQEIRSPDRRGVARYENLLNEFGLGGSVRSETKSTLFEMGQVRNLIAHRNGVADRQFVETCAQLGLKIGETLPVTDEMMSRYFSATFEYSTEVLCRVADTYGSDLRKKLRTSGSFDHLRIT